MSKLHPSPSDRDRCLKVNEDVWARLGTEAAARGMSRPNLANLLIGFMLEHPEIIDVLHAGMIVVSALDTE